MKRMTDPRGKGSLFACLLLAVALSGCGTATSGTSSTDVQLRGIAMSESTCPPTIPTGSVVRLSISEIESVVVCAHPNLPNSRSVTLARSDKTFNQVIAALAAPDQAATSGVACPAYADLPQPIVANTLRGAAVLVIPLDGCGHYQQAVNAALRLARPA